MNEQGRPSDFSAREAALAERLRAWDPARQAALPPQQSEQPWFRERLMAEARANVSARRPAPGWLRLAGVAAGALLLLAVSILWQGGDDSRSGSRSSRQAAAPKAAPELPRGGLDAGSGDEDVDQPPIPPSGPAAVDRVLVAAQTTPDLPSGVSEALEASSIGTPEVRARTVTARQLQMRGSRGTRLLWTLDPEFEWAEPGD